MEVGRQLDAPAALLTQREPRHPLNSRRLGPLSQPGHFGEELNILLLPGFKPHSVTTVLSNHTPDF